MTLYTWPTSSRVWEEIEIDESTTINNNNIKNLLLLSSILSGFFQEQVEEEAGTQNWRPFCKLPRREHCKNLSSVFLTGRASPWGNIFWYSSDPILSNIMANCILPTVRELQRMSYRCRHTKEIVVRNQSPEELHTLSWSKKLYMFLSRQVLRCLPPRKDEFCSTHRCTRTASLMDSEDQSR